MTTEVVQILERARKLLGPDGERWTQYSGDEAEAHANRYCLIEALNEAVTMLSAVPASYSFKANQIVRRVIGGGIIDWNDAPGRTFSEVSDVLQKARDLAREE